MNKLFVDTSGWIALTNRSDALYTAATKMYASRPDKDWGIVDCISFVIMQERSLTEVLTADRHYYLAMRLKCRLLSW